MDEARRVIERLRRIEELRRARAEPAMLLGELRALVAEGRSWIAAERRAAGGPRDGAEGLEPGVGRAARTLADLEDTLDRLTGEAVRASASPAGSRPEPADAMGARGAPGPDAAVDGVPPRGAAEPGRSGEEVVARQAWP